MQAKSIIGKSAAEIKAALDQSIAEGYKPTLAFVFMSLKQEWPAVQALLNQEGIAIFGATTAEQGISNAGITLLLLDIDPHYFKLVFKDFEQSSPFQSAGEIAETGLSSFPNPAFIIVATVTKSPGNDII